MLQPFLRHMLHHHNVRQFAAQPVILIRRQIILIHDCGRRTLEVHRIGHGLQPGLPPHLIQLALQPGRALQHPRRLLRKAFLPGMLQNPPKLQRRKGGTGTVNHRYAAVQIRHVKGILVVHYFLSGQENASMLVHAEELVPADRDGIMRPCTSEGTRTRSRFCRSASRIFE